MRGFLAGVLLAVLVSGSGCAVSADHDVREACEAVCDCTAPLPAANRECNDQCVATITGAPLPDVCLECLEEATCRDWQECAPLCN